MTIASNKFEELRNLIVTLRQPDGCPWDIRQTPESIKSYLIEEAHELLEAIDRNDPVMVKEELGDLFFQLLFVNQLFEEQGHFTLSQVLSGIAQKMIQRHPHVFGDEIVASEEDQRRRWNEIKSKEKKEGSSVADLLRNVPGSLPGLRRAQRVSERAAHNGFEWQDIQQALAKLHEEFAELQEAIVQGDSDHIEEELGDVLFMLVNLGRLTRTNCEEALHRTTGTFIKRLDLLERKARESGRSIGELSMAEQLTLWAEAKKDLT